MSSSSDSDSDAVMTEAQREKGFVSALDMPDVPSQKLPPHLELRRTRVLCNADAPDNVFLAFYPPPSFSPVFIFGVSHII